MFVRNNLASKLPTFLRQLKSKKTPRLECRSCQQSFGAKTEQPYLWSPELLWSLNRKFIAENKEVSSINVDKNEKLSVTSCNGGLRTSYLLDQQLPFEDITSRADSFDFFCDVKQSECRKYNKPFANKNSSVYRCRKTDLKSGIKTKSSFKGRIAKRNGYLYLNQSDSKVFSAVNELRTDKVPCSEELVLQKIADRLTEEWPLLFQSPIDVSLCSEKIYFDNTVLKLRTRGIRFYKLQTVLFKWITKSLWTDPSLQILQLTKHVQENTIRIRWQVSGKPKVLYPLEFLGKNPSLRYLDYFSILYVGEDEKIAVHHLTKVVPTHKTQRRNPLQYLLALLGLSGTKMHIPSLQEEPVIPSSGGPS